tara:strand:+ start:3933 stop:4292 length:360 start_codon:yes stop_codon:yes gene_type:complete
MNKSLMDFTKKKHRQAGYGFMVLNVLYLVLVFSFLPSFTPNASTIGGFTACLIIFATFSFYIWRGKRLLTLILAVVYGLRSVLSAYTLIVGSAFTVVPYVLPLLVISFYLLGRAVWNWP